MFKREYRDYSDVLILPNLTNVSSRKYVDVERTFFKSKISHITAVPIIASNMDTTGTFEMALALSAYGLMTALHKHYTAEEIVDFFTNNKFCKRNVFITVGLNDINKLIIIAAKTNIDISICVDIANGYIPELAENVRQIRKLFPRSMIMAGNVTTRPGVKNIAKAGANIIKIGIGGGAHCRTRVTAGVGMPMITAIEECAKEAKRRKVLICADGGISEYSDFAKAYVAGADFVMVGSMFAAHDESGGEVVTDKDDNQLKPIYGMSSETAMNKYSGGVSDYRTSEGRTSLVPVRGPIANTVSTILGSIRSACTYTNSYSISGLKRAKLITVRNTVNRSYEQHTVGV